MYWVEYLVLVTLSYWTVCFLTSTTGSRRKFQEPSSNLRDEEGNDEERASPACKGIFYSGSFFFCLTCGNFYETFTNIFGHQFPKKAQQKAQQKAQDSKPQNCRERIFTCEICDKSYCGSSSLNRHRRTHFSYSRPSSCSECGKRFRDQSEVKRHKRVHQKKKPLAGNQEHNVEVPLPRPESQASRRVKVIQGPVARAKASHDRASSLGGSSKSSPVKGSRRNIICPYCFKHFTTKTGLLNHLRFHLQNQPTQCFSSEEPSQSSMVGSQSSNTEQTSYCCPTCDICFRGLESLLDH